MSKSNGFETLLDVSEMQLISLKYEDNHECDDCDSTGDDGYI